MTFRPRVVIYIENDALFTFTKNHFRLAITVPGKCIKTSAHEISSALANIFFKDIWYILIANTCEYILIICLTFFFRMTIIVRNEIVNFVFIFYNIHILTLYFFNFYISLDIWKDARFIWFKSFDERKQLKSCIIRLICLLIEIFT